MSGSSFALNSVKGDLGGPGCSMPGSSFDFVFGKNSKIYVSAWYVPLSLYLLLFSRGSAFGGF